MNFGPLLTAHGFMRVERPPHLWDGDTDDVTFIPLLGEMIAAVMTPGTDLSATTLNASNVVIDDDGDHDPLPVGEFVAITTRGPGVEPHDGRWLPSGISSSPLLTRLHDKLIAARVCFAYVRALPGGEMTVTVMVRRAGMTGYD